MNIMNEVIQLTPAGILFLLLVREMFSYLKGRKENGNGLSADILKELQLMNGNHLHSIQEAIENGNNDLKDTLHNDFMKMIELLAEIKGKIR